MEVVVGYYLGVVDQCTLAGRLLMHGLDNGRPMCCYSVLVMRCGGVARWQMADGRWWMVDGGWRTHARC